MIQRLMSQVSEKYAKDNNAPLNEAWILSELSQNFSLHSTSNFNDPNSASGLLGSNSIDFSSQIFDNSNIGPSPLHRNHNASNSSTPFKAPFNDKTGTPSQNTLSANGVSSFTTTADIELNVKASNPFANDTYKIAFNNSTSSAHAQIVNGVVDPFSMNPTHSDVANNNKSHTLIQ